MLRSPFNSERIERIDPRTGIKVIQITSYPTPSIPLFYAWPSVTPDNQRVVFYAQRSTRRGAPTDLWRCDTDGLNLFQLTERDEKYGSPTAVLGLDGKTIYAFWGDQTLCSVQVETGEIEELINIGKYSKGYYPTNLHLVNMGKRIYIELRSSYEGGGRFLKLDLVTGEVTHSDVDATVIGCDQSTGRLVIVKNFQKVGAVKRPDGTRVIRNLRPEPMTLWYTDENGGDERYMCRLDMFGHSTFLGKTSIWQGTGQPPERCIWLVEPGKDPYKLVEGPYFWHCGPSFDGEWIISDTSWPNVGLQLVHVPTRHFRTLCHDNAEQGHAGAHPHPALSQDGRVAVFDSDMTGVRQVYIAHITEEFRESIKEGVLDNPNDKWML